MKIHLLKIKMALLVVFLVLFSNLTYAYDCSGIPTYPLSNTKTGDLIVNNGSVYRCDVSSWCNIGGPYEPGVGWAWTYAWAEIGTCDSAEPIIGSLTLDVPDTANLGDTVYINVQLTADEFFPKFGQELELTVDGQALSPYVLDSIWVGEYIYSVGYQWQPTSPGTFTVVVSFRDYSQTSTIVVGGGGIPPCAVTPVWHSGTIYTAGDEVRHDHKIYRAKWWTLGDDPSYWSGPYHVWEKIFDC